VLCMRIQDWIAFLAVIVGSVFFYKSLTVFWADSELWAVTLSKEHFFLFDSAFHIPDNAIGMYFKPLHHLMIKFIYFAFPSHWDIMAINRIFGAIIGLGSAYVYSRIFHDILSNKKGWAIAFVAIVTTTLYFERGFRIRADLLASLFHGLVLYEFFRIQRIEASKRQIKISMVLIILYETAMVASTVKYLPIWFLLNILYFFLLVGTPKEKYWARFYKYKFIAQLVAIFILVMAITLFKASFLTDYLKTLSNYASQANSPLFNSYTSKFVHIYRWIIGNPALWVGYFSLVLFSITRLFFSFEKVFTNEKNKNFLTFYSVLLFGYVLMTPEKYAYYIASVSPLFSILAVSYFLHALAKLKEESGAPINIYGLAGGLLLVKTLLVIIIYSDQWTNFDQRRFQFALKSYIEKNNISSYYDPIGILPRDMKLFAFLGPNQYSQNKVAFEKVMRLEPELIVCTRKCNLLPFGWHRTLVEKYEYNSPSVFNLKGLELNKFQNPTNQSLNNLFRYDHHK